MRGKGGERPADVIPLVRFALGQADELAPYAERVEARFAAWLADQEAAGRRFDGGQRRWLEAIRDHVARSLRIDPLDFEEVPFSQQGGLAAFAAAFGPEFSKVLDELNEVLVA